jgi:hypothetical protein
MIRQVVRVLTISRFDLSMFWTGEHEMPMASPGRLADEAGRGRTQAPDGRC